VRRPDEVTAKGSFPVYLSVQAKDLEKNLAYIPKDRIVLTVSNHAHRAGAAGDLLSSKGFKVAGAAGSEDYEAQGGKIARIAPPAPKTAAVANAGS
jgi:rhodanese-related sulfurtransferase